MFELKANESQINTIPFFKLDSVHSEFIDNHWIDKSFRYPNAKIRLATMFSGIGAIEFAFKRLKLNQEIVFASDCDKFVKQSYFANYNINEENWYDDVYKINGNKYQNKIDVLVGGSPCQSFSMVGKRKGFDDTRGTLFYEFARVVKESQPKIFIYENVKGLLNHDNGNTFEVIKATFDELGYSYYYKVLNAKDYGIPQHRERIFIIGFKNKDYKFSFPKRIPLKFTMQDFLEDYTESKYYLKEKGIKFVTSSKNRKKRYTQINGEIALCQKANQQFNWHGDFIFETIYNYDFNEFIFNVEEVEEKYYLSEKVRNYVLATGTKNFKTSIKTDLEIARPLLQSMHKMHRAGVDNYVTHNKGRIRKLTPKECLRLMGFTDNFKQVVSDTQLYRQAGNSIVVDVLIAILKQIDITQFAEELIMKIILNNQYFNVVDTIEKITIADSFVVRQNKIGTGNGEAKLYIGQDNKRTRDFFGNFGFSLSCFLTKTDLQKYLEETKAEYLKPEQPYANVTNLPKLWQSRKNMIDSLPDKIEFEVLEQTQIRGPRVYINSNDKAYKIIRELSLPNITFISVIKLLDANNNIHYYFRLFADYFGEAEHPFTIEKSEEQINSSNIPQEEKKQLIKSRIGQGDYRIKLLTECPFCPITLISDDRLLIASHIKPWSISNDFEKTDPKNGFMLTPTFDRLFDRGFLSFTNDKRTILSPFLSNMTYSKLNISDNKIISHLPIEGRELYLEYHRNHILKK